MLAGSLKKKKQVKKVATPQSGKVDRKRKISNNDELTEKDITDLLGVELVSSKEDKKETVLNSPTLESAKKKKKKSLEKATISPEKNAKPSETEQASIKEHTSQKKKRKTAGEDADTPKKNKTNGGVVKESSTLKKRKKTKSDEAKDGERVAGGDEENHIEGLKELQLKQEKRKDEDDKKHLYVSGFSNRVTEADLKKLSVDITDATIKRTFLKKNKGGTKCYAYLKFESEAAVERNVEKLKSRRFKGCELEVDYVGAKSAQFKAQKHAGIDPKRLYITGFNRQSVSEEKLKGLFEGCVAVDVPRKRKDQEVIGYAFVTFNDEKTCRSFFEKDESVELDGCKLNICLARSKKV